MPLRVEPGFCDGTGISVTPVAGSDAEYPILGIMSADEQSNVDWVFIRITDGTFALAIVCFGL